MLNIIVEIASWIIFMNTDYLQDNFTEFAGKYPLLMFLYGLAVSFIIIRSMMTYYPKKYLIILGAVFSFALIIPYHIHPIINELHTFLVLFPVVVILFLIYKINKRYQNLTVLIGMVSIYLYIYFGIINSVIELIIISYTNLVCYLLKLSSKTLK